MNISVYMLCYNESKILNFTLDHYFKLFPNMNLIVYDNYSTDNSREIITSYGGEIRLYNTNDTLSDQAYLDIKNNCWKNSSTDWNIIIDADELICINDLELSVEENSGSSIISFEGYNMIGSLYGEDVDSINSGSREQNYDKLYCFNKKHIQEINYDPGCHKANPVGNVVYSQKHYKALHYKWISYEYVCNRYKHFAERLSEKNKEQGWGFHYMKSSESILEEYLNIKSNAIKLL